MVQPTFLPKLTKFVARFGTLPTSYRDAMTYEEQILWICSYIENTLLPALNQNSEALEELQGLFIQLKDYVDNYFDNLDVQEEINNKLDAMVEAGTLQEIITEYLQVNGVLAYTTKAAMKAATNLIEGSVCKTLGDTNYIQGDGHFYRVRELLNTDVIDDTNIIALTNYHTLIAELIPDASINSLDTRVSALEKTVNSKEIVLIGDSYGEGLTIIDDTPTNINSWCDVLVDLLNLTSSQYYKFVKGSTGFHARNSQTNQNFLDLLRDNIDTITDKAAVKSVVVCGGYNDNGYLLAPLKEDIAEFCTYAKAQLPNAKIYIGLIGSNYGALTELGNQVRANLLNNVYLAYSSCQDSGAFYLNGVENVMHDASNFCQDLVHPNQTGYNKLGQAIYQAMTQGKYEFNTVITRGYLENSSNYDLTSDTVYNNNNVVTQILGDIENVILPDMTFNFHTNVTVNTRGTFGIGIIHNDLLQVADTSLRIPVIIEVTATNTNTYKFYGNLRINQLNALYIEFIGKTGYTQPDTTTITTTKLVVKGGERIMPTKFM